MKKKFAAPDQHVTALSLALQQRRMEMGLSQDELADKAGLHRTYVSLIERKSCNFSIKIYMRLAFALDVDPAELMRKAGVLVGGRKHRQDKSPRPA
jgi:transcriptional regulator with XRE-family HTH domain